MNKAILCLTVAVFTVSVSAYEVNGTQAADPNGRVEIENIPGKIVIKGWERPEISVSGELDKNVKGFRFEVNGRVAIIKVDKHRNNGNVDRNNRLEIMLPLNSEVEVESTNADVSIEQLLHKLEVDLVNGDIITEKVAGEVEFNTINGDIRVRDLAGEIELATINGKIESIESDVSTSRYSTVNGEIKLEATASRLVIETINGDVQLKALAVKSLELNTVNGEVDAELILVGDSPKVVTSSVSGDISLAFEKDISARFNIEAHAGGDIDNELSEHRSDKGRFGLTESLEFELRDGDARVDMTTVSGNLTLKAK